MRDRNKPISHTFSIEKLVKAVEKLNPHIFPSV